MKNTAVHTTISLLLASALLLAGCAAQRSAESYKVYDFGPAPLQVPAAAVPARLAPLVLFDVQVAQSLEGNAVLYRLAYADAQQLKPYALARWSMPPAQLVAQRLRQQLGLQRAVVAPGELLPASAPLLNLRLVLEEFSQVFDSPADSHGLLRLRATLTQRASGSEIMLAQRSFVIQQIAATPDAQGAVRALTAASDELALQVEAWLALWRRL